MILVINLLLLRSRGYRKEETKHVEAILHYTENFKRMEGQKQ